MDKKPFRIEATDETFQLIVVDDNGLEKPFLTVEREGRKVIRVVEEREEESNG